MLCLQPFWLWMILELHLWSQHWSQLAHVASCDWWRGDGGNTPFTNHNSPHSKLWPMLWQQNVSFDYLNIGRKLFVLFIKDDMTLLLTATWYSKLGCCFKTSCCCWGFFYKFLWRGTMSMPTSRWHKFSFFSSNHNQAIHFSFSE